MIKHIAFIMDGNRRYAKTNNLQLKEGYEAGLEQFFNFVKYQIKNEIYETSFWALSTENWKKRDKNDLEPLYDVVNSFFCKGDEIETFFLENKIKIETKGDIQELENKQNIALPSQKKMFLDLKNRFEDYNNRLGNQFNFKVNLCLNYGGHREILFAFKNLLKKIEIGELNKEDLNEDIIKQNIYYNNSPAPEIIVRPGNVQRLSGFMSWDSAYSEIYFSSRLWPEFKEEDFNKIINWFNDIQRNFGK